MSGHLESAGKSLSPSGFSFLDAMPGQQSPIPSPSTPRSGLTAAPNHIHVNYVPLPVGQSSPNQRKCSITPKPAHSEVDKDVKRSKPEPGDADVSTTTELPTGIELDVRRGRSPLPRPTMALIDLEDDDAAWRADLSLNFERKCHAYDSNLSFDNIGLVPENVHDGVQDLGVGFDALEQRPSGDDGELAESIVADSSSWSISGKENNNGDVTQGTLNLDGGMLLPSHDNANYAIASTDTGLYQPCNEADASATRQPTPELLSIASPPAPQPASLPAKEYNCYTPGSPLKNDVTHELLSYYKQHGCPEDAIFLEDPIPTPDSWFSSNGGGPIRTDRKGREVEKPYRRSFLRWRALRRNPVSEGSRDKWFKAKAKMPFSSSTSFLGSGTPAKTKATGSFYDWRTFSIAFYEPDDLFSNQAELAWMDSQLSPYYDSEYARSMFGDDNPESAYFDLDATRTHFLEDVIFKNVDQNGELKIPA